MDFALKILFKTCLGQQINRFTVEAGCYQEQAYGIYSHIPHII